MNENLELAPRAEMPVARTMPNPAEMMQAMIKAGITESNVAAFTELVKLSEHMEDRNAEREFARAFVDLQSEMRNVKAVRTVPNNDGSVRYKFAPFEDIMAEVGPLLKRHGFTVTFSTDFAEGRIIKICTLQHVGGHSKSNKFAARIGKGPPGATETQGDGAASTYAKRFALCDALNIVCDRDDDARAVGAAITPEQAEELSRRVQMTNSNRDAFLKFAGAKSFEEIPAGRYDALDEMLKKKESRGR